MHFVEILVLMFCKLSLSFPAPVGTIIAQVQQYGLVDVQQVMDQVLLNGVSLTGTNQKVDNIIQTMSADAHLPTLMTVNHASGLRNYTVLRSRECILKGSQLHWTDRVFFDGMIYLTLDYTDTWTALVPQAMSLKVLWDQEVPRTRMERIRLHEGCIKLMRELRLFVKQSDIVVKLQQWGVVSVHQVVDQVLLNGVSLIGTNQEVDNIVQTMTTDSLFPTLISVNHISVQRNHTVLRSRECTLKGSQLHWTDSVFYDGKVYLTLDNTDSWTALVPQAMSLKVLWDQEVQRTSTEKIRLQEGCDKLITRLSLSLEQSVQWTHLPPFVIPVLAVLVLITQTIVSYFLAHHHKKLGVSYPGGVIGSIVHYPKNKAK